ncbi:hypothetical protein CVU83_02920 [Candidatus Falkowbacteria bacterium HGW-Falkowbacteria-2]|uniref:NTP pyrophosphohydrolase MazG putative catalytic core domain-containing protein n=1 Tax=Candidatus Falkowbacteria bacterium HGW-Falkowbacteria-2 TaxID=2013769 RepID=A0A2N2DYH6_9BACT|nr:MAG: hypothetical protein CVU83_02920 [Candidatus Falkowbacteria bacterium HGW-Falkowbacteria-2]
MESYNKLVRDYIGDKLKSKGLNPELKILTEEKYLQELLRKLVEESNEALCAGGTLTDLKKELCDVLQVVESIVTAFKLNLESVPIRNFTISESSKRSLLKMLVQRSREAEPLSYSVPDLENLITVINNIIDNIILVYNIDRVALEAQKKLLEKEDGGFHKRLYLFSIH